MRPNGAFWPIGREPFQCTVVAAYRDVRPGTNGAELLAVLEDTATHRLVFDVCHSPVFVGHLDEMINVQHAAIIGNLTGYVNGFLTGSSNYGETVI